MVVTLSCCCVGVYSMLALRRCECTGRALVCPRAGVLGLGVRQQFFRGRGISVLAYWRLRRYGMLAALSCWPVGSLGVSAL